MSRLARADFRICISFFGKDFKVSDIMFLLLLCIIMHLDVDPDPDQEASIYQKSLKFGPGSASF